MSWTGFGSISKRDEVTDMLSDVMEYYGLAREFQYAGYNSEGYYETEHLNQVLKDVCAAIQSGGLIAVTGPMGSGKTATLLRIRRTLERDKDGKVLVSRSLAVEKERVTLGTLMDALFFDLSSKKEVKIPTRGEHRARELQSLFKQARRPVALFVDDAHRLNGHTRRGIKRLIEALREDGVLAIVLAGQPKLKNDLLKPTLEEVGYRSEIFTLYGVADSKREYIEWLLKVCSKAGVKCHSILAEDAIELLAERLHTPLEIESNLKRVLEAAYQIGEKPVTTRVIDSVVPAMTSDLEATLIRNGYDLKDLAALVAAKPREIKLLLQGHLEPSRAEELLKQMREAGLPIPDAGDSSEATQPKTRK
jgi:type II secretory pathway predicted ATPase ExeA